MWNPVPDRIMHLLVPSLKSNELFLSVSVIWFYVQAVLIILAAAIGLALNVTVTEFVDTVCSRHILACMTPLYILELFHVRKTIQIKISRMSNNGKAKIFYHEIMVVW